MRTLLKVLLAAQFVLAVPVYAQHGHHEGSSICNNIAEDQIFDLTGANYIAGENFQIFVTAAAPLVFGEIQTWYLNITDMDGTPVVGATVGFDADMIAHGHGMPTEAVVSATDVPGLYIVEGVMQQMPGQWTFAVMIEDASGSMENICFHKQVQ